MARRRSVFSGTSRRSLIDRDRRYHRRESSPICRRFYFPIVLVFRGDSYRSSRACDLVYCMVGVGHWFRAAIVAAVSFLPFVQSLWGLRDEPLVRRILLALDNASPYAFVGMLFAQLFASTAGLGFLIVVMRAEGNSTEALAISLITFGLLVAVS